MLEAIAAVLGALATIMPALVQLLMEARQRKEAESDAVVSRDLGVLHTKLRPPGGMSLF